MEQQWFDRAFLDSVFGDKEPNRKQPAVKPKLRTWLARVGWVGEPEYLQVEVQGTTKSEARAALKRHLEWDRLPPGTRLALA